MRLRGEPERSLALLGLVALLVFSFIGVLSSASGFTPTVPHTAKASGSGTSKGATLTVNGVGDTIVAVVLTDSSVSDSVSSYVLTVTDTASSTYTKQIAVGESCIDDNPGVQCVTNSDGALEAEFWTAPAEASGAVTVTATVSTTASISIILLDIPNVSPTAMLSASGVCKTSNPSTGPFCNSATGVNTASSNQYGAGSIAIGGATAIADWINGGGTSYTYLGQGIGHAEYSTSATSPTVYPFTTIANVSSVVVIGMILGGATTTTTTSTTTINTVCAGVGCSGGANATGTHFSTAIPALFVFVAGHNDASTGQIDNFTMKVKAVHINAATGNLDIGVYMPTTPTAAPSAANPYVLTTSVVFPVQNGTTNYFIHSNPQTNICASCYWAAGIMASTTASRGSGATGSGVSFYESSDTGVLQYNYNPGGTSLPSSFFSSTLQTPRFFMAVHETFSTTVLTSTVTSTLTGTGTFTSTISTTITSTTLDMNLAVQSGADYGILAMVILLPAFALMVPIAVYTKSAMGAGIGFIAGLMLGSALGVQAGLVPQVFLGIMVVVGIFIIVGLSKSGGGGP